MLKAAIFDMDGVIVDNRDAHLDAFVEFARRHNQPLNPSDLLPLFGSTNEMIMGKLFGHSDFTPEQIEALSHEKEKIYREIYDPVMVPARGLIELLKALKARGVKTSVGSSAPRINVDFVLERCGIAQYFDAIACGDEITHSKPDPEVYLLAAKKLGVSPADCVVFEDAHVGIEAARRAGMWVVAVASTFERASLKDRDLLIDNFVGLQVDDLEGIVV